MIKAYKDKHGACTLYKMQRTARGNLYIGCYVLQNTLSVLVLYIQIKEK